MAVNTDGLSLHAELTPPCQNIIYQASQALLKIYQAFAQFFRRLVKLIQILGYQRILNNQFDFVNFFKNKFAYISR